MKPSPWSQLYLVLYQERELSFLGFYQFIFKRKSAFLHKVRMQILSSYSLLHPTSPKQMPVIFNPTGYVLYEYEGEPELVQKHFKILNLI